MGRATQASAPAFDPLEALGLEVDEAPAHGREAERRLLRALLDEHLPAVGWTRPQATCLAWLDCQPLGLDDGAAEIDRAPVTSCAGPAGVFLREAHVAVSAGPAFGNVRLHDPTSAEVLEEAVRRTGEVVQGAAAG